MFVRDPETFELYWVDMTKVVRVIVNENEGKRPEQYVIRDINPNFQNLSIAPKSTTDYGTGINSGEIIGTGGSGQGGSNYTVPNAPAGASRFEHTVNETVIDAKNVVHLGLSEGLDFFWPFSQSVLEMIFKVFKQKELLEDAILIYRVQRAPERRVFYIDVGNMPITSCYAVCRTCEKRSTSKTYTKSTRWTTNNNNGYNIQSIEYQRRLLLSANC